MKINAAEELILVLDEIDAKIKHLENSPNRAFVLIEYDTLSSFHYFNLCFKNELTSLKYNIYIIFSKLTFHQLAYLLMCKNLYEIYLNFVFQNLF